MTLRLGGYGKPTEFYSEKSVFHLKLGLSLAIELLSIYPAVFFFKNRKGDSVNLVTVPKSLVWIFG